MQQKIKALLFSTGVALFSGAMLPQASFAQVPMPALVRSGDILMLQGKMYPVITSLPVILNRRGSGGTATPTNASSDGRYELVELVGGMSSRSVHAYTGRTAYRLAKVKDKVTGQEMEAYVPLIVRY